ncbi:MAG: OmpA family protein [Phycisphaerae bacterium]|nr:OmpA family protein [Phycisphaerae bacterium]
MTYSTWKATVAVVILAAVSVTGCCESELQLLKAANRQNDELMSQNKGYRDQIADLDKYNAKLGEDIAEKDKTIAAKNEEIATLKVKKPAPTPTDTEKDWTRTTVGDKISVGSDVLFSSGRATLTRAGKARLNKIVKALKGTYSGLPIRVYGFTDSDPIRKSKRLWKDNLDLSANRAMAVTRYLISRGISKEDVETVAMGATHYVDSNKTRAGKKQNRRVEILVVKKR